MKLRDYAANVIGDGGGGEAAAEGVAPPYIFAESKPLGSKSALVDIFPEVSVFRDLRNILLVPLWIHSNCCEAHQKTLRASTLRSDGWRCSVLALCTRVS